MYKLDGWSFFKNSFQIVMRLSIQILLVTLYIILKDWGGDQKIFLESFVNDKFSDYFKIFNSFIKYFLFLFLLINL